MHRRTRRRDEEIARRFTKLVLEFGSREMPMTFGQVSAASIVLMTASGAAFAGFSGTMFESASDPAGWAGSTLIASLDSASTGFNYTANSGFAAVFSGFELDRTHVISDVYRLSQLTTITNGPNSISLQPGDLVFAYRVRLVSSFPGLTVESLNEAQVIGAPDFGFGENPMDASLINGQGFVTTSHFNNPEGGNIDDAAEFGSSVDFEWPVLDTDHLNNGEFITLLMFTSPANIGRGVLNLNAPPGQSGGIIGVAQGAEAPPILIPITIPAPGAAGLIFVGALASVRRRQR